jgi:acetyl-CoA carboxylase, biotin carboxylase subunit
MIAKIVTKGENREEAIAKMKRALQELVIHGVETNQYFQEAILEDERFVSGDFDTDYLQASFLQHWQPSQHD